MGRRYLETELRTATPVQIVTRLLAAVLRHVDAAVEADRSGDAGPRGEHISRALAIVAELRSAVDFERGAEIAQNLESLYEFACVRLLEANQGREQGVGAERLEEVRGVIRPLHEAWAEIARNPPALEEGPA